MRLILIILFLTPIHSYAEKKQYQFSFDWLTNVLPTWQKYLAPYKGKKNLHYLEVGVFEGRSFFWIMDNIATHKSSKLYALDIFDPMYEHRFLNNLKLTKREDSVKILKGFSTTQLRKVKTNSIDIIYIDGSHLAKDVLFDIVNSWELLKEGGLLILDDYGMKQYLPKNLTPKVAIDGFMNSYQNQIELIHKDWQVILKKTKSCPYELNNFYSKIGKKCFFWNQYEIPRLKRKLTTLTGKEIKLSQKELKKLQTVLERLRSNISVSELKKYRKELGEKIYKVLVK